MKTKFITDTFSVSKPSKLVFQQARPPQTTQRRERAQNAREVAAKKKLNALFTLLQNSFLSLPNKVIKVSHRNRRLEIKMNRKNEIVVAFFNARSRRAFKVYKLNLRLKGMTARDWVIPTNVNGATLLRELNFFNPKLRTEVGNFSRRAEKTRIGRYIKMARRIARKIFTPKERKEFYALIIKRGLTRAEKARVQRYYQRINQYVAKRVYKSLTVFQSGSGIHRYRNRGIDYWYPF